MQKKRTFRQFIVGAFSDNSPSMTRIGQVCVLVICNLLWLVCCVPVLTAGAATAALDTVLLRFPDETVDSAFKDFFSAFRLHLREATPCWLVLLAVGAVLAVDFRFLLLRGLTDTLPVMGLFFLFLFLYLFLLVWTFPVVITLGGSPGAVLQKALLLSLSHLGRSFLCAALLSFPAVLAILYAAWFLRLWMFWLLIGFALFRWGVVLVLKAPLRI